MRRAIPMRMGILFVGVHAWPSVYGNAVAASEDARAALPPGWRACPARAHSRVERRDCPRRSRDRSRVFQPPQPSMMTEQPSFCRHNRHSAHATILCDATGNGGAGFSPERMRICGPSGPWTQLTLRTAPCAKRLRTRRDGTASSSRAPLRRRFALPHTDRFRSPEVCYAIRRFRAGHQASRNTGFDTTEKRFFPLLPRRR